MTRGRWKRRLPWLYTKKPRRPLLSVSRTEPWADGTKDPKHVTVLLRDGKGTLAKDEIPTGMKPDAGFAEGAWDTEPETAKDAIASDLTYTFVFEKAQTAPETPEDPETPSIPGTGDMPRRSIVERAGARSCRRRDWRRPACKTESGNKIK